MREALSGWCSMDPCFPGKVEEILRTYMINGTPAAEVVAHANSHEETALEVRRQNKYE